MSQQIHEDKTFPLIKGVPLNGEKLGVNTAVALFEVGGQIILRGGVAHPEVLRELNE